MECRLRLRILVVALVVQFATPPIFAGELGEFLSSVARDTKRRNCWPEPFVYSDREMTRQINSIQINAGWERQNLLSDFHFTSSGTELTEAGRMRVLWIVNEAAEAHRQVFVHRANTPQETVVRMQTVQRAVAQTSYGANVPVLESTRTDDGWPASRVNDLAVQSAGAAVPPKLLGSSGGGAAGH
jgi:hypothetical protein